MLMNTVSLSFKMINMCFISNKGIILLSCYTAFLATGQVSVGTAEKRATLHVKSANICSFTIIFRASRIVQLGMLF